LLSRDIDGIPIASAQQEVIIEEDESDIKIPETSKRKGEEEKKGRTSSSLMLEMSMVVVGTLVVWRLGNKEKIKLGQP
jgi:hypothetical protein